MPRNGSGTYTLPAGNPVVTGTVISSTVHNNTMSDIASEMTNSVDKDGQTVYTGNQDYNGNALILDVDGDSKIEVSTDDRFDITLGGVLSLSTTSAQTLLLDAIAKLTPADSNIIVGNGTTFVAESGATARTSLGLGTGDSPQFTNVTLSGLTTGHVLLGNSAGALTALDVTAKGSLIVGDGSGAPQALAASTNTYVLTLDSAQTLGVKWAPVLPGMVLLSSATAANDATVSFTGLSSTYYEYIVEILNVTPATDGSSLYLRTSTNNGSSYDSGASDYVSATTGGASAAAAQIAIAGTVGSDTNENGVSGNIRIMQPSAATYCHVVWNAGYIDNAGAARSTPGFGFRAAAADVDAIQLFFSAGNIESGVFNLYGAVKL